jgi:hypothetical protein
VLSWLGTGFSAGSAAVRQVSGPAALLAWLGTGFSAQPAEAKVIGGPVRQAAWLGNRFLAVWGEDVTVETKDGGPVSRSRAYGVRLIDTRSWTIQTLTPDASQATLAGNRFLAYGGSDGSADGDGNRSGLDFAGLRIFTPGGGKPVSVLEGRHLTWVETYGTYAYVPLERPETPELENGFAVVDLRTGEVVGKQRQEIPLLLS